tara:strand:- start:1235 stop:3571 length:2337 start_codon:yes stop_codon:yes gene_type:complete
MADFSEKAPEKLQTLSKTNKDQIDKLAIAAVEKASTSNEDANLIAKVVSVASDDLANKVVEEVSKNNTTEKQDLSAKVLKAIVETQPNKIEIINEEIKDVVIKQTVEAVKKQQENQTNIAIEDDLTDAVAAIIVGTDNDTASKLIEEVSNIETDTNLSLKVIAGISEKDGDKFTQLSETNKEQVEKLTISAIQKAENTSEDSQLIANVVAAASDELANKVVEEVSKTAVDEKKSLSVKVLKAIVDTEPKKIEIINEQIKEDLIEKAIEATKDQKEGNLTEEEEENLTDAVTEIIVKTDTITAAKVIDEINQIDTETNLSLEVISGISEKDTEKLNELSKNNQKQMDELTINAVQKAENTSEDSQLIANVIAVVNDDLVNKVVEEVSKVSVEEKQTLSVKVLKAIVDTEPSKIENIDEETKTNIIKQTLEAAKNQEEGQILEEENLSDIVAEIVVKTDVETASKIIEEVNNTETETTLSLKVMSGISDKDSNKINELADSNKENIDKLTEKAIRSAKSTNEDSKLIAKVVSVANEEIANKVVEEVSKTSLDETKQSLSAKVLNAIVKEKPDKFDKLNSELKETVIAQTVTAAKNQREGSLQDEDDLSNTVASIIIESNVDTASRVLKTVNDVSKDTEADLSLGIVSKIPDQKNYDSKLEILVTVSKAAENELDEFLNKSVDDVSTDEDLKIVSDIILKSKKVLSEKLIDTANSNESNSKKITKALVNIINENPDKAVEIINKNKKTKAISETIKTKIESDSAVTIKDFNNVFDTNISPN